MEVFLTSPWVPAEWISAHGHQPRGIWVHQGLAAQGLGLGAGVCPFAQRALRFAESRKQSCFVFTTHCDQLRRAFDSYHGAAPERMFLFNLPATWQTAAARKIVSAELRRLGQFLVQIGGQCPTARMLVDREEACSSVRARLALAGEWCFGSKYAQAIAQFHWDGSLKLSGRNEEAQVQGGRAEPVRLALLGGPLCTDDWLLMDQIEALGGVIVLNGTENGERSLAPIFPRFDADQQSLCCPLSPSGKDGSGRTEAECRPTGAFERATEELATRLIEQCADVFQRPNTRLYTWLGHRLEERKVRGIVLLHYVGCDLWRAEAESLRETFKLPLLRLEVDEASAGSERNIGRLQAFLEALR
jgi:benzoyl-CoA reductase/2-hydroxyglutaryl-CoA dehydratase subunit BcrC/BadD/HgdB